ncbi:unnamed protein product [Ranitomeya imitator]|uniref:Uncharacterized protein n=1 Tax=Ranitomeya imitator TaxID=111125 RepID=A0ABN9MPA1_9NEOB|nr:unnamed protein product [Ranitomeya imitator]
MTAQIARCVFTTTPLRHQRKAEEEPAMSPRPPDLTSLIDRRKRRLWKCAMISAHYGLSDVFDNLIISLCKFTTLSSEDWRIANVVPIFKKGSKSEPGNYRPAVENIPTVFGSNPKAHIAAKTVFHLAHRHGDILREGWKKHNGLHAAVVPC